MDGRRARHWEGNTLVIQTVNFTDERNFAAPARTCNWWSVSRASIETMIDYQFTVTDPKTWARPLDGGVSLYKEPESLYEHGVS
jgi:hypothetical protein